ncbi:MAG: contractile injection system tape measure protein, partial [Candidatus Methylumidiphilus sp.]
QERAILLLHYLTHGRAEAAEPMLTLNKLLCGWPLAEPTAKAIDLSEAEQTESAALIASATAHWKALKGTSPDGFRRAFLQRDGRLSRQESGWHLLVPRVGYDVLLDSLPWGIGLVMLPWMAEPLAVEW